MKTRGGRQGRMYEVVLVPEKILKVVTGSLAGHATTYETKKIIYVCTRYHVNRSIEIREENQSMEKSREFS